MSVNGLPSAVIQNKTTLSTREEQLIASAPPEKQAEMRAQLELQKQSELVTTLSNMMKALHEMSMAISRNIG
jgi:hypothetical protein